MDNKIGSVPITLDCGRVQRLLDELGEHLQAAQSILDDLGTVEVDVIALTSEGDTPDRS